MCVLVVLKWVDGKIHLRLKRGQQNAERKREILWSFGARLILSPRLRIYPPIVLTESPCLALSVNLSQRIEAEQHQRHQHYVGLLTWLGVFYQ